MDIAENLNPSHLRYLLYLVTPNETTFASPDLVPNYTDKASIWMLILVLIEFFFLDDRKYAFNDTLTSINAGILSILFKFGGRSLSAYFYEWAYARFHIIDLDPMAASTWILAFFAQDLAYYLGHRAIHEAGVFWSFHQMHHSSEYYNLSTALRQGAIQDIGMCFFDLLQAVAVPPNIFTTHRYLNVLYQFWLHTQLVPYLGPLEYFFNTPSSHRVHHGRNPYCIDKNYGGTLIIWDRLFGTYVREREGEEIAYGLVHNVNTFDQLYCQFFMFWELGWKKPNSRDENGKEFFPTFTDKLKAVFFPPGWPGPKIKNFFLWKCCQEPSEGIPEIEADPSPHNPPLATWEKAVIAPIWLGSTIMALKLGKTRLTQDWPTFLNHLLQIVVLIQAVGLWFDRHDSNVVRRHWPIVTLCLAVITLNLFF